MPEAGAQAGFVEAEAAAASLLAELVSRGRTIAFAESCTGGLLSAFFTSQPGSSAALWGGVTSYSESAKEKMLGVKAETIQRHGVVSLETVGEMARGLLLLSGGGADFAVATSGFAGPDAPPGEGGPGRVCIAWASRDGRLELLEERFPGGRAEIRTGVCVRVFKKAFAFVQG